MVVLLHEIVKDVDQRQKGKNYPAAIGRMNGLADGFDPHLLEVCHMVLENYKNIRVTIIA